MSETTQQKHLSSTEQVPVGNSKVTWILFSLLILVVLIIRMNFLSIPFERDDGTYNYFGQLVLDGKTPYLDFYETKPPGIFYCYAFIISLFGPTLEGSHLGFMVLNLLSVLFVFRSAALIFKEPIGLVVATAFAFLSMNPHLSGFTTQSEHIVTLFVSSGLFVLLRGLQRESMPYYFFSGVLFCAAMLVKQNGAFFAFFGGLAVISHHLLGENRNWKKDFASGLIYSAGVIIPLVLTLILMFMNSALDEFIYWIYNHAKDHYVTSIEWEPTGKQMLNSAWTRISKNHYLLFLLAILGFVATAFTKLNLHRKSMIFCFSILSFAAITPGLRFYGHYWIFLMPAVALLIGVAVLFCNEQLQKFTHGRTATTLSLGIFAIAFMHHLIKIQSDDKLKNYYTHPNSMNVLRNVYGRNPFPEAKLVGDWIKNNSDENENISVLGSEPQVYFYANRRGVSKHNYLGYLVQNYPLHSQWQREFISDVEAAQPKYFVFFKHRWSWMVKDGIDQTLFKWMNNYTKENYQLVGLVQYRSDEQLDVKWGQKGAAEMLQEVLARKRILQVQLQKETASKNQYAIANLRNQLRIFDYQTRIYQRK